MRLIDADALMESLYDELGEGEVLYRIPPDAIDDAPTVDAVEVVRCKDCDWHSESEGVCINPKCGKSWHGCPVPDEHYCSHGEWRRA